MSSEAWRGSQQWERDKVPQFWPCPEISHCSRMTPRAEAGLPSFSAGLKPQSPAGFTSAP